MKNRGALLWLISAVVVLLYFAVPPNVLEARPQSSAGATYPELLSQIPPGASSLVFIDLTAVRTSPFFRDGTAAAPFAKPDSDYAAFVQATGFDYEKDLDRAAIAVWPAASPSDKSKTVIFADGRFDQHKIRDYAMQHGKIERQLQHDVFVFPAQNPQKAIALVFVNDHRVAMVEGSDATPVLGPPAASPDDPIRQQAALVDGAPVFAVSHVPPVPDGFAVGGLQSAQLTTIVRSIDWVTFAARPEGDALRVSLEAECHTDTDARQLQALLQLLRMFGQAALSSPQAHQKMDPTAYNFMQTFFQTSEISQAAQRVRIRMELTPDTLRLKDQLKESPTPSQSPAQKQEP